MADTRKPPSLAVTAVLAVLAALLWLAPVVVLFFVPFMKRRYDEFGLQLSYATRTVFDLYHLLFDYWWLTLPTLVGGMVLIVGVGTYIVRHHVRAAAVRVLWWLLAFALPLLVTVVFATATFLPELRLQEGLNK